MNRPRLLLLTPALALALAGPAAPADAKRPTCSERGGATVVRTSSVRVFKKGQQVYGCHRAPRRIFRLGEEIPPDVSRVQVGVRPVRVAGSLVGYSSFANDFRGGFTSMQSLRVRDLRAGRTLRVVDYSDPPDATVFRSVTDLELMANGSLAWVLQSASLGPGGQIIRRYEVRTADGPLGRGAPSANRVLDPGPDIAPESLTLKGNTLSWTRSGQIVSAPLR